MNWTQIKVKCDSKNLERVSAIMSMLDPNLMIEDYSDMEEDMNNMYGDLIDESLKNADREHSYISLFVSDDKAPGDYVSFIKERALDADIDIEFILDDVADDDWGNSWRKYYKPVRIGEHIVIVPAWQDYENTNNDLIVKMDPGLAFGSGTHETTRLCATLIEKYMKPGDKVLDVGTGSGILAIIESKMGARSVDACDIDPVAVRVAKENATEDGCPDINCFVSDLLKSVKCDDGYYDFVSANIVSEIIIRMAPDLPRVIKKGGLVVCSGIIDDYKEDVISALKAVGFEPGETVSENDWNSIVFKKV